MSKTPEHPSQLQVNRMHRVMSGEKLNYTVVVYMKSGRSYEYQSDTDPSIVYDDALREAVIRKAAYGKGECIVRMSDVEFVYCEKNPD